MPLASSPHINFLPPMDITTVPDARYVVQPKAMHCLLTSTDFFALLVDCFIKITKNTMMLPATMLPHILDARYMAGKGAMPLTLIFCYSFPLKKPHNSGSYQPPHLIDFCPQWMPPQFWMWGMWHNPRQCTASSPPLILLPCWLIVLIKLKNLDGAPSHHATTHSGF